jgi:hypothetical protein
VEGLAEDLAEGQFFTRKMIALTMSGLATAKITGLAICGPKRKS